MLNYFVSLFAGFVFAIGLGISGMTQPQKVMGFLDLFGQWNPALAFVMIGAIAVHSMSYIFASKKKSPVLDDRFHIPKNNLIDAPLVIGSALFGIGWGLGGFCPGPAITSLVSQSQMVMTFILSMLVGILLFKLVQKSGVIK